MGNTLTQHSNAALACFRFYKRLFQQAIADSSEGNKTACRACNALYGCGLFATEYKQRNAATAKYFLTQNTQNVLKRKIFNKINVVCAGKNR